MAGDFQKWEDCKAVNNCRRCALENECVMTPDTCKGFIEASSVKYDPGSRYYDAGGLEVQDIIRAKLTPEQYEGFCLGNIIKYSCRANWKGQKKRDIEKVGFYQMFLDEAMEAKK